MRRVLAIAAVLGVAALLVVLATTAGPDNGGAYRVRAIFMNAFSVIPGEDVKIAGVRVGQVDALDVTSDHRAVVVLRIDRPGFDDFRQDAECSIRPQSLIGEKFVECQPTQPRPPGAQAPPPLKRIEDGEGEGQYLLPVERTSKVVDLDLVNNILRLPYRQRLSIIINELGTALAGRGGDLRQAIANANPALKETDKVLEILGDQNDALADLARDSDAILAPLARDRQRVAGFIDNAGQVARATAERSAALEQNIAKLPAFLRELRPTMVRLGALSDEMTPVLRDLGDVAPDVSRFIAELGPFARSSTPALASLGDAADVGREALVRARPIIQDLGAFARTARPLSRDLAALLTSVRDTGGIERAMDYLFFTVAAINGYDSFGHYLRAGLIVNNCASYALTESPACTAKFQPPEDEAGEARSVASRASSAPAPAPAAVPAAAPPASSPPAADADSTRSLLDYLLDG